MDVDTETRYTNYKGAILLLFTSVFYHWAIWATLPLVQLLLVWLIGDLDWPVFLKCVHPVAASIFIVKNKFRHCHMITLMARAETGNHVWTNCQGNDRVQILIPLFEAV